MKVAVVGAGIAGVTTAYELAMRQHEVTVFERAGSVATQGSFALPGVAAACAPLGCAPWGVPGLAPRLASWMGPRAALRHLPWAWQHARAASPSESAARVARATPRGAVQMLAHASRKRLGELTQQLSLAYEQQAGVLVLLTRPAHLKVVRQALATQAPGTEGLVLLEAEAARLLEPGLAASLPLLAAVQLPSGMVGNGRQLAQLLKNHAQKAGADFRFDQTVASIKAGMRPGHAAELVLQHAETLQFDAVVVCAGMASRSLLSGTGLKLPLLAPWGYAVTMPLGYQDSPGGSEFANGPGSDPAEPRQGNVAVDGRSSSSSSDGLMGPRAGVIDAASGVVINRLGQRVRASCVGELGGPSDELRSTTLKKLHAALESCFPGCAITRDASHWKGPRPQVPDGAPLIGPVAPGVWLNAGHGAHGWALACGAAQLLAQQLTQEATGFDAQAFSARRFALGKGKAA